MALPVRRTLPSRVYTDGTWYTDEMERIFATMWLAACRLDQIESRGSFVRRDVAGASILIVGDGENGARAFYNVCRHRGTRLCDVEAGRFSGSIQCPYHGWTYDLQGRLIGAPQMDEVEGFAREDFPLASVGCAVWDGHVFINLSAFPI